MILSRLIEDINCEIISGTDKVDITSVVYDSRAVKNGSLFVCVKGYAVDGHAFIDKAAELGAAAIVVQDLPEKVMKDVTFIKVDDTREALAKLAAAWFDHPAEKLTVIGLTGTKGKTTVSHMIKKILEKSGKKVGMIGTIGAYIGEEKLPTVNTTPESFELHSLFSRMLSKGCTHVVMEVSSQGLKLKRTAGINFDVGAFLNLSPDHISPNEHKDFEEYKNCKAMLFSQTKLAVVNLDAEHWKEVTADCENLVTVSCEKDADYTAKNISNMWKPGFLGVSYDLCGKLNGSFALNMPGEYNVQNALVATAICDILGIEGESISAGLESVSVKGRTQVLPETSHFSTFIIDYAHNAISTESLLKTLKSYGPERLVCIFGGGGNKPKQRRFDMGQMAGRYADLVIITMDNPRYEPMEEINKDIIRGIVSENGEYIVIDDRKEAIEYMLERAGKNDIVAMIGKGHEEYQEVNGEKFFFSEHQVVKDFLNKK